MFQQAKLKWISMQLLIRSMVFFTCLCFIASYGFADVIRTTKGHIEGRVLEEDNAVIIAETVAGEYVVIEKNIVNGIEKEDPADFYFRRGRWHEGKNQDNRAMLDYLEALNVNPDHQKAQKRMDAIKYRKKQEKWQDGLERAQQHLNQRDYRAALNQYQEVLNMDPDDSLAQHVVKQMSQTHTQIAYLYYNHCYDEGAILELAKAEELNPESAEIYFVLGRIHQAKRQFDQARLEYERALQLNPNHAAARRNLDRLIQDTRNRTYIF